MPPGPPMTPEPRRAGRARSAAVPPRRRAAHRRAATGAGRAAARPVTPPARVAPPGRPRRRAAAAARRRVPAAPPVPPRPAAPPAPPRPAAPPPTTRAARAARAAAPPAPPVPVVPPAPPVPPASRRPACSCQFAGPGASNDVVPSMQTGPPPFAVMVTLIVAWFSSSSVTVKLTPPPGSLKVCSGQQAVEGAGRRVHVENPGVQPAIGAARGSRPTRAREPTWSATCRRRASCAARGSSA